MNNLRPIRQHFYKIVLKFEKKNAQREQLELKNEVIGV